MTKTEKDNCFYCGEEIENIYKSVYIGIDTPYINLNVHDDCWKKIREYGEEKYLQENKNKIFKLAGINSKTKKKNGVSRKR